MMAMEGEESQKTNGPTRDESIRPSDLKARFAEKMRQIQEQSNRTASNRTEEEQSAIR